MFKLIHNMKERDERGFTLVELLIVIAIIAILAAIAIPQFAAYRTRAVEGSMTADARNAATVLEAYFSDNQSYTACAGNYAAGANANFCGDASLTLNVSTGNAVVIAAPTAATYTITITNPNATRANRSTYTLTGPGGTGAWT